MKKIGLLIMGLLSLSFLAGCSNIYSLKTDTEFANNEIKGKSLSKKIYYKLGSNGKIKSMKVDSDHSFYITIPRASHDRSLQVTADKSFNSKRQFNIPASSPIMNWADFVDNYNEGNTNSYGEVLGPSIKDEYKSHKNGIIKIPYHGYTMKANVNSGKLISLELKLSGLENYVYLKGFKENVSSVLFAATDDATKSELLPDSYKKDPSRIYGKSGAIGNVNYHISQVTNNSYFDIWAK